MGTGMTDEPATLADKLYRYDRFTTSLLLRDMRFRKGAAGPGDLVPAFILVTTDGQELTNQNVFGYRPVMLIFGSITCPMTASTMPFLTQLHSKFGDRVATFFSPFSRDQRGVAAVLTLALGMLLVLGLVTAWIFG